MSKIKINLIIFFISFFTINSQGFRILNYYNKDHKIFSIEEKENNFQIVTKQVIYCITTPCDPIILNENTIENYDDCQSLKSLFDEIFKDSQIYEKNIVEDEFPEEQLKIILEVLKENKIICLLEYEIINNLGLYNSLYKNRGYLYFHNIEDDSVSYTIAMGLKPSGGYYIEVKEVVINGNDAIIYVIEKRPGKGELVSDALTYPIVQVKFNKSPSYIEIFNYYTGESYPRLN